MDYPVIDSHIHLDLYSQVEREFILKELKTYHIKALISVSNHLESAQTNLAMAKRYKEVNAAFGFHPEQELPTDEEIAALYSFINEHKKETVAIGEVGLPYYLKRENQAINTDAYIEVLELFIKQAACLDKPIILHAVYDDAPIVCDLLEKHSIKQAHFHWFKGDQKTIERMMRNNYFISVTPDVLYEKEIQSLVKAYPLSKIMVETDGPWPFEGAFKNKITHPKMLHLSVKQIAAIKRLSEPEVYNILFENTKRFYF